MSGAVYVSTVGYLAGDACLNLPKLILLCRQSPVQLICGTYARPVFEFAQCHVKGCDFGIIESVPDPDDYANPYTPAWGAAAYIRACGELAEKYPGLVRLDQCAAGIQNAAEYPLEFRYPQKQGQHVCVQPYTRHDWKNLSGLIYRLRFDREIHQVGFPDEPELPGAVDLRKAKFEDQALDCLTAHAVFGVASAFACLASLFLKRQVILSYTEDVSFWPHNPNAIKLAMPSQAEAQAVIEREGL